MRKPMAKKVLAASLAAAMTMSIAACGDEPAPAASNTPASTDSTQTVDSTDSTDTTSVDDGEEVSEYTVLIDPATGAPYDLGGIEVVVRDWFTSAERAEAKTDFEEAQYAYQDWIQETYNFKIKQMAISDWASAPQDFADYAVAPADDKNYVFTLRDDPALLSAMTTGLCYDLSTLDCLDFNNSKFTANLLHKQYSKGGKIYAMYAGYSEARTGVYFNKRLLKDAGIDPESLYEMQANGTWTWDKFKEMLAQVQRDTDGDGEPNVWGANCNDSYMTAAAVYCNGGEFIGQDASGKYVYKLEDPKTLEGLQFAVDLFNQYWQPDPVDDEGNVRWDYYKEAFCNGECAFMVEDAYAGQQGQFLSDMEEDFGFVAFPKGPSATDYTNKWSNNPVCIPANYDADRAWKIAFAWNLYTDPTPGYEDSDAWKQSYYNGFRDTKAVDETIAMLRTKGMISFSGMIPDINEGPDLLWNIGKGAVVSEVVSKIAEQWKGYIDAANK